MPTAPKSSGRTFRLYLFCLTTRRNKKKDTAPITHAGEREMKEDLSKTTEIFTHVSTKNIQLIKRTFDDL